MGEPETSEVVTVDASGGATPREDGRLEDGQTGTAAHEHLPREVEVARRADRDVQEQVGVRAGEGEVDRATRCGKRSSSDADQLAAGSAVEDQRGLDPARRESLAALAAVAKRLAQGLTDDRWYVVKLVRARELEEVPQPLHRLPQLGTAEPHALGDGS